MNRSITSSDSEEVSFVEQERILKSSNIFKQKEASLKSCQKHPNKKAKYYVQHDKTKVFCSKCALNLALQGLKIEETNDDLYEIERQKRIKDFQNLLKNTLIINKKKIDELQNIEQSSIMKLQEIKQNCLQFFDQVIQTANQLSQTYLTKFSNDHATILIKIQEKIVESKQIYSQLEQFEIDIEKNHDNIVKKMEMKPFEEIMSKYEKKVFQISTQLQEHQDEFQFKIITFDQTLILSDMNKMCYNLLVKDKINEEIKQIDNHQSPQKIQKNGITPIQSPKQKTHDLKVFEILEAEDIYQSTCSNPVKEQIQSPQQQSKGDNTFSNPATNYSKRESHTNTPESWQHRTCLPKTTHQVTPNEKEKHNISLQEQLYTNKNRLQEYNERALWQQNEKQKTTNDQEQNNSILINNLSCMQMQKIKEKERNSLDDRELTPKHQKNQTSGPQTFKLFSNNNSQRCSDYNLKPIQYQQNNNNLYEQKSQKELQKNNYDSVPNQKSLTPHHQEPYSRINQTRQEYQNHKRSNSKQPKQPSIDQIEGRRQFILSNAQYISQPQIQNNEDTLKDRILKELCSHPSESVYNQVLKLNNQQKLKNQKLICKENQEQSSTVRTKSNGYLCVKKQSHQQ